jgi:predicted TIM-barrel fold metal-dependent hydrolase
VAIDFPELVIVAGHIGYPWTEEMIALARKYPNVYIDTSAYAVRRYPPELVSYLRSNGRGKVLFGTNYPMILPAKALRLDGPGHGYPRRIPLRERGTRLRLVARYWICPRISPRR